MSDFITVEEMRASMDWTERDEIRQEIIDMEMELKVDGQIRLWLLDECNLIERDRKKRNAKA